MVTSASKICKNTKLTVLVQKPVFTAEYFQTPNFPQRTNLVSLRKEMEGKGAAGAGE